MFVERLIEDMREFYGKHFKIIRHSNIHEAYNIEYELQVNNLSVFS